MSVVSLQVLEENFHKDHADFINLCASIYKMSWASDVGTYGVFNDSDALVTLDECVDGEVYWVETSTICNYGWIEDGEFVIIDVDLSMTEHESDAFIHELLSKGKHPKDFMRMLLI